MFVHSCKYVTLSNKLYIFHLVMKLYKFRTRNSMTQL